MNGEVMQTSSLIFASALVIISLLFSCSQKLKLEKDIVISIVRAVVQLLVVGYLLNYIFGLKNPVCTTLLLLFMALNGAYNAGKRGKAIKNVFLVSFLSIAAGGTVTLSVLVLSGALEYEPYRIIPVGGMIISNAMVAIGICYNRLCTDFAEKTAEIETKLALGADVRQACSGLIKNAIRTGMMPTIDSAKTLGIVSLPGMMTGLILAGASPVEAVKYQIMVTFMLLSTASVASFIACYFSYRSFFNDRKQLV